MTGLRVASRTQKTTCFPFPKMFLFVCFTNYDYDFRTLLVDALDPDWMRAVSALHNFFPDQVGFYILAGGAR
jgi:hypothetical protein